jgi:hypothetical protein
MQFGCVVTVLERAVLQMKFLVELMKFLVELMKHLVGSKWDPQD